MRSFLTGLGIAIGIAAVILLTSIGEGLHQFVLAEFSQFGTNIITHPAGQDADAGRQRRHLRLGPAADAGGCRCLAPSAVRRACQPRPDGQCRSARQRQDAAHHGAGRGARFRQGLHDEGAERQFLDGCRRRTGARAGRDRREDPAGTVRRAEPARHNICASAGNAIA